jgi:CHASE3 domain sensor protein
MPTTDIRSVVTRTLALPVLLLLAFAVGLGVWIVHLLRSEAWVQHSYDVIGEISETQKLLIDQETGLRAFILAGDPAFLSPYVEGTVRFAQSLAALRREIADNPRQVQRIAGLEARYRVWVSQAEVEKRFVVTEGGQLRGAAIRQRMLVRKQQMDQMRADFRSLHDEEQRLLRQRLDEARRANRNLFVIGALLVVVCAAMLYYFLRGQLKAIDQLYLAKVEESESARRAAEALAAEVQEQSAAMETALLTANRERDQALRSVRGSGTP